MRPSSRRRKVTDVASEFSLRGTRFTVYARSVAWQCHRRRDSNEAATYESGPRAASPPCFLIARAILAPLRIGEHEQTRILRLISRRIVSVSPAMTWVDATRGDATGDNWRATTMGACPGID
jgi:hypothetical protein